jgi:ribosomal protein L37E
MITKLSRSTHGLDSGADEWWQHRAACAGRYDLFDVDTSACSPCPTPTAPATTKAGGHDRRRGPHRRDAGTRGLPETVEAAVSDLIMALLPLVGLVGVLLGACIAHVRQQLWLARHAPYWQPIANLEPPTIGEVGFLVTGDHCDRCGDTNYDEDTLVCLTCYYPDDPCSRAYLEAR